ncbi:MAG: hypothetical protein PHY14_01085 [Candidatus Gracilibacteria bacterium]|nr:hypothetical protein [Candidatus Gracilibacteria bacterium]
MLRRILFIEHSSEQEQSFIKRMEFIVNRGGPVDEWVMGLYRKEILKRYLFACNEGELYLALEKMILEQYAKGEAQKVHENPKISGLVQANILNIITVPAANDSDIWNGIGKDTRHILEKYGIGLADISIPFSQLNSLSWIYDLEREQKQEFTRQEVLEMIAIIPELLKIQL